MSPIVFYIVFCLICMVFACGFYFNKIKMRKLPEVFIDLFSIWFGIEQIHPYGAFRVARGLTWKNLHIAKLHLILPTAWPSTGV